MAENEKYKKNIKISFIGFDWNDIGFDNIGLTMSKLNRDGLRAEFNDFLLLYAGNKISRGEFKKTSKFIVWHLNFLTRLRIVYDILFIFCLPLILLYERFKPNVFYLSDFPYALAAIIPAKIFGGKIILRLNTLPRELALSKGLKGKIFYLYYLLVEKIVYRFIDGFVAINYTTENYLLKLGVEKGRIFIDVPDTISRDEEFIKAADRGYVRKKYNFSSDKKIILSVGSLIKEKGFDDLITAFAKIKRDDLMLIICGEGGQKQKLIGLAEELGVADRIILPGGINRKEIWDYYAGADIFMLFSKSESLGMVFWEAIYAGLPIIGSPVGGVKETIGKDGERGFYWQKDIKDLEKKIDFCLASGDKLKAMIGRAGSYVREMVRKRKTINEIYREINK